MNLEHKCMRSLAHTMNLMPMNDVKVFSSMNFVVRKMKETKKILFKINLPERREYLLNSQALVLLQMLTCLDILQLDELFVESVIY